MCVSSGAQIRGAAYGDVRRYCTRFVTENKKRRKNQETTERKAQSSRVYTLLLELDKPSDA